MTDKYPEPTGRRRFVKGVVGGSALAGVGAVGGGGVDLSTPGARGDVSAISYYGVANTDGPAPRALPQLPVRVEDGRLVGIYPEVTTGEDGTAVARERLGGVTYSPQWFQYCGVEAAAGLDPEADRENTLRHAGGTPFAWQRDLDREGEPLRVEEFDDYEAWGNGVGQAGLGKPARATWRTAADDDFPLVVEVIRSPRVEAMAEESDWLAASTDRGFLAYLAKCTHFCCVPAFKAYASSATADAEDLIYCACHQSVYDPFQVVRRTFTPRARPRD